jgi:hypothetical protein
MIVKMSEKEYKQKKDEYIFSISKNGLISTNPVNGKSYLFRTVLDKGFSKYMKISTVSEEFMRLVIAEASGEILTFIEDSVTVPDDIPVQPVSEEVLNEEIKEVKENLKLKFGEYDLVYGFQDHQGFVSY